METARSQRPGLWSSHSITSVAFHWLKRVTRHTQSQWAGRLRPVIGRWSWNMRNMRGSDLPPATSPAEMMPLDGLAFQNSHSFFVAQRLHCHHRQQSPDPYTASPFVLFCPSCLPASLWAPTPPPAPRKERKCWLSKFPFRSLTSAPKEEIRRPSEVYLVLC